MTKTAIRRLLMTSVPAAVIAATTFANASTVSVPRAALAHPAVTRPGFRQMIRTFANNTPRTTFVGGGATLPALAYEGANALTENPATPSPGSIFAEFATLTGVTTQYCQTGSGFGRNVYTGAPGVTGGVNGACPFPLGTSPTSTSGFGAPLSLGLTDPDLTGTDIPMSQTDYTNYVTDRTPNGFGEPVSVPSIIGSVALLYNLNGVTTRIALTDKQICEIVEGKITNWKMLSPKFPNTPLFFVYRSDGSGTTFSFSNHEVAACGTGSGLNVSQAFTAAAGTVSVIGPTVPANFVGESGNVGVANEIVSHNGYIGYAEAANALADVGGSVNFATVNGKDPIKNLPETAATFGYTSTVVTDSVVATLGGPATVQPLSPAPAKAGCVVIAVPSKYANPKIGYPIIAITNVLFSSAGNGSTNATNLQALVTELNTRADFAPGKITSVDPSNKLQGTGTTGYSALGATFNASLIKVAKSCIGA